MMILKGKFNQAFIHAETIEIDEAPMVYKNAQEIERLISETVEVANHLKVLANFKGF